MIEKRLAQWYAADASVDLDIAEREIVLTYVLRILTDHGLLKHLAFKGGTAIRKLYLGSQGRFSLDLDLLPSVTLIPKLSSSIWLALFTSRFITESRSPYRRLTIMPPLTRVVPKWHTITSG